MPILNVMKHDSGLLKVPSRKAKFGKECMKRAGRQLAHGGRHTHRNHSFQFEMHALTEQVERLAMKVLPILLVVRPLAGWISLLGYRADCSERLTLAFFGIRGVGSIYYLAYGINHMPIAHAERLWGIVGLVVLCSILLHGLTVTPIMRLLDLQHGRDPDAVDAPPPGLQGPAIKSGRAE